VEYKLLLCLCFAIVLPEKEFHIQCHIFHVIGIEHALKALLNVYKVTFDLSKEGKNPFVSEA
jgi:hypothetical protein